MPFAASSAMLSRRGQVSSASVAGESLAAPNTSYSEPREQYSAGNHGYNVRELESGMAEQRGTIPIEGHEGLICCCNGELNAGGSLSACSHSQ